MFFGRQNEIDKLNQLYEKPGFDMVVIYGRRRVGKTTILNEFCKDKEVIFFTAEETTLEKNLDDFSKCVFQFLIGGGQTGTPTFSSLEDLFRYIGQIKRDKLVVVLDEFPYLAMSEKGVSSMLQKVIDHDWIHKNIFLILCGSSVSFMEENVLGEKSPIFGRRTAQMNVKPFDYLTAAEFVPDYTPEEKAIVYGVTGGVAKYLSLFQKEVSLWENIESLFFSDMGYLYEEPQNLLRQEFRSLALYNTIIDAIAAGATHMNEISGKTGYDSATVSQAVKRLISVRIIKKDVPILNEKSKRNTHYMLMDGMFRFWYRFVYPGKNAIERGAGKIYFRENVKPVINDYMGLVFEEICREYTFREGIRGAFGESLTNIGKWRGNDNEKKEPADIDVVGVNDRKRVAVLGECKFRNEEMSSEDIEKCIYRGHLIPYEIMMYLMFSKGGYSKETIQSYQSEKKIRLLTIGDLYAKNTIS